MENKTRFETLLQNIERDGMENLISFIRKSDFYTAPASTRYHLCCEGGLLQHSLNVYDLLQQKQLKDGVWKEVLKDVSPDSIVLVSLLHDLCKTYFYEVDYKNQKVYDENGSKKDEKGRFDWQIVPYYKINDKIPLGHGEKSVMMIEEFIRLKPVERYANRWHMGFTEEKSAYNPLSAAINLHKLVLALHESDLEATYLLEGEE